MRKLLIVLAILTFATAAFAGDVTIQFNNAGGNSWNGVSTYPYLGSVNAVPTDFMCVSYNEHITGGESWQAMQYTVAGYSTLIGNPLKAEGLAYLYNQANLHPTISASINAAAWAYNEGSPDAAVIPQPPSCCGLLTTARTTSPLSTVAYTSTFLTLAIRLAGRTGSHNFPLGLLLNRQLY